MKMKVKRVCLSQHQKSERSFLLLTQGISSYSFFCLRNRSRSCLKCQVEKRNLTVILLTFPDHQTEILGILNLYTKLFYVKVEIVHTYMGILSKPCDLTRFFFQFKRNLHPRNYCRSEVLIQITAISQNHIGIELKKRCKFVHKDCEYLSFSHTSFDFLISCLALNGVLLLQVQVNN